MDVKTRFYWRESDSWRGQSQCRELLERAVPHNLLCERAVLGAVMVAWKKPNARKVLFGGLTGWDFWNYDYRHTFLYLKNVWPDWKGFNGRAALYTARAVPIQVADMADILWDADVRGLETNCDRLRALRRVRGRIFAAVELLRMSWTAGQWDDETEKRWASEAQKLLDSIKI